MAEAEALLSKLSGISQNSDVSRIVSSSRIPILSLRSVDSKARPLTACSRCSDSQSSIFLGSINAHKEEEGDGRNITKKSLSESGNHLDDSGYESSHMKGNECDDFQNNNLFSPIPTSESPEPIPRKLSPTPVIKASRIPISDAATKIQFKRHNFENLSSEKRCSLSSKIAGLTTTVDDQRQKENYKGMSEENFLRFTKSSGLTSGSLAATVATGDGEKVQNGTFHSRSLPVIKNLDPLTNGIKIRSEVLNMLPPRFTSTPIKSVPSIQFPCLPVRFPSFFTTLKGSESFQAIKSMVDEDVNRILDDSRKEFGGKYSEWIQQVFNLHLEKIHSRLKQLYTARLDESLQAKDKVILDMKCRYREKLLEFEEVTRKFQLWYDEVLEDNRKQTQTNEMLIAVLKEQEAKLQMDFKINLEDKILELETNFEKEKQQELNRHAVEVQKLQERCNLQQNHMVQQYEYQITSLKTALENVKITNISLNETILSQQKVLPSLSEDGNHKNEESFNSNSKERDEMQAQIQNLKTQIKELKTRNQLFTLDHTQEITKFQKKLDANNQNLERLINERKEFIQNLQADRERRVREMKAKIQLKEQEHRIHVTQITERYGQKIEELTKSVQLLQNQILQ